MIECTRQRPDEVNSVDRLEDSSAEFSKSDGGPGLDSSLPKLVTGSKRGRHTELHYHKQYLGRNGSIDAD